MYEFSILVSNKSCQKGSDLSLKGVADSTATAPWKAHCVPDPVRTCSTVIGKVDRKCCIVLSCG